MPARAGGSTRRHTVSDRADNLGQEDQRDGDRSIGSDWVASSLATDSQKMSTSSTISKRTGGSQASAARRTTSPTPVGLPALTVLRDHAARLAYNKWSSTTPGTCLYTLSTNGTIKVYSHARAGHVLECVISRSLANIQTMCSHIVRQSAALTRHADWSA